MSWDEKIVAGERVTCIGCQRHYDVYQPQVPYVCAFCTPTVSTLMTQQKDHNK